MPTEDHESRTEAEAARAAAIIGRSEHIGSDVGSQEFVTTPFCSVCQRGTSGYVCGPCKREAAPTECRRCGLTKRAATAGVLCEPGFAYHDFPRRDES